MKKPATTALLLAILMVPMAFSCNEKKKTYGEGHALTLAFEKPDRERMVVYQLLTRLFSNTETANKTYGTLEENGVGTFNGITEEALSSLRGLGVTHVWLTGILEHATMSEIDGVPADDADVVKGRLGSPYAIKDYYDVAPALAENPENRMAEFEHLLQRVHASGMKVVIDFIPNHVARSYHSDKLPQGVTDLGAEDDSAQPFSLSNNFYYLPGTHFNVPQGYNPLLAEKAPGEDGQYDESPAKVTGNNIFSPSPSTDDWFETVKLNYGVVPMSIGITDSGEVKHFDPMPSTWLKMRDILLYWAGKGVDGFRCDIAEMVPAEFWGWAIGSVKEKYPDIIFIAEIYNTALYHDFVKTGKFDYLYDKVGVYDRVRELMSGGGDTRRISESLRQFAGIEGHALRFLENHDEQRIASREFAGDPWTAVPGMTLSALLGTGPTMIYFGQEVGETGLGREGFGGDDGRTTIFDYWGVPEHQKWVNNGRYDGGALSNDQKRLREFYGELLRLSRYHDAFRVGSFLELPYRHPKVYAFLRYTDRDQVLVVVNFDREQAVETGVQIPAAAWQALDLSPVGPYQLVDLLLTKEVEQFDAEDALEKGGLRLSLPPNSAYVYEIEAL